jgi:hypothetical protein
MKEEYIQCWEDMEKLESSYVDGGNVNGCRY